MNKREGRSWVDLGTKVERHTLNWANRTQEGWGACWSLMILLLRMLVKSTAMTWELARKSLNHSRKACTLLHELQD